MKSAYSYGWKDGALFIIDEGVWSINKTVTNDMENVLAEISEKEKTTLEKKIIVYSDSEGIWSGVIFTGTSSLNFIIVSEHNNKSLPDAIAEMRDIVKF